MYLYLYRHEGVYRILALMEDGMKTYGVVDLSWFDSTDLLMQPDPLTAVGG